MKYPLRVPGAPKIRTRRVRCPRCGAAPETFSESWEMELLFFYDGERRDEIGEQRAGQPTRVHAHCGCGHRWCLKGVKQVTELDVEFPTTKEG